MRPLHHKIVNKSWLTLSYIFRSLFLLLFLLSSGFVIGLITGLYQRITITSDIWTYIALGMFVIITFVLWLLFLKANRKQQKKEELNSLLEYLEELRAVDALSHEDFLREKENILKKYYPS